jgi:hypothetical protein
MVRIQFLLRITNQMEGQSQSPLGILATISTRPYLIEIFPAVVNRAERTGFIMVPFTALLDRTH